MKKDYGADGENSFADGSIKDVKPNEGPAEERSADSKVVGAKSGAGTAGDVGNRMMEKGPGFLSKAERPYHGSVEGRFEDRQDDEADTFLQDQASKDEDKTVETRSERYANHGNVGFAGNYPVDWKAER